MQQQRKKRVAMLGSTGSVGSSALALVRSMPERFRIVALSAGSRWKELARQIEEFKPEAAALANVRHKAELERAVGGAGVELLFGQEGLCELVRRDDVDVVLSAIAGWAGFSSAVEALKCGHLLALANKESLVVGGGMLLRLAKSGGGMILPVDSEHSAIMQALRSGRRQEVARVVITASGGPFWNLPAERLAEVTPEQALSHPTWSMGKKITIDSATLMNKALEVIEARWLFELEPDRIDVLIHPQSIIHAMVEFLDGSVVAQLGVPDMKLPIQFALLYPERVEGPVRRLDLAQVGRLEMFEPDHDRFPALKLGYEVARRGGTSGAALNAANEVAVRSFLEGRIRFTDIVPLVRDVLEGHEFIGEPDVAQLVETDRRAREETLKCLRRL